MEDISISDHALIRWLERGHGVDMEEFRDILREEVRPFLECGLTEFNHAGLHWISGRQNGKQQLITVTKRVIKVKGAAR